MSIKVIEHEKLRISRTTNEKEKTLSKEDAEILSILEKEKGISMFKWGKDTVSPQQWVGVILLKNTTLEILPKISDDYNEIEIMNSLIFMINTVYRLDIKYNIKSSTDLVNNGLFDILINHFLDELNLQLNQGIDREYIKNKSNISCVKGKILFNKHIQKNLFNKNKFICEYSILAEDYLLNRIIKTTLLHISNFYISNKTKAKIRIQLSKLSHISEIPDASNAIKTVCFNRKNERFRSTINYCNLLLNHMGISLSKGKYCINSFLIDMNKLFEEFIYKSYKKIYKNNVIYQNKDNYLLYSCSNSKVKKINLRPDIMIKEDSGYINIIDTKWKVINKFVNASDIYQMNAYIYGIPKAKDVILIFPKNAKNDNIIEDFCIKNNSFNHIKIRTIDLTQVGNSKFYVELQDIIQ